MTYQPASKALEGLVVLDMTHMRAGPVCVRQLADWGANVIKIDRPGDPPDFSGRQEGDYQNKHRNKRSIAIDLKSKRGQAVLHRLVQSADIIVENFRPNIKRKLKFDYETLQKLNPKIILCSISAFGQDGPYQDRVGVDQIIQGMSGLMSINGIPGQGPLRVGIPIVDICAGLYAALGITTALVERNKSGRGQWVQTSLIECMMFFLDIQAARYLADGIVGKQVGNEHPTGVPTNTYKTKDGYINLAPVPSMWGRFCKAIDRPELITDPDFSTREVRRARRREINSMVQDFIIQHETAYLLDLFEKAEVPCGPIYNIEEAFNDPQVRHLKMFQSITNTNGEEVNLPRQPFALSRTPSRISRRNPKFSEHTKEVLSEFGFSENEIEELSSSKIIG